MSQVMNRVLHQATSQKRVQPPRQQTMKRLWARKVVRIPFLCLALLVTIVVVGAGFYYTWAYSSTSTSIIARGTIWSGPQGGSQVTDYQLFPSRTIATAASTFSFPRAPAANPYAAALRTSPSVDGDLARFLAATHTTSFLVIKQGQIVYEVYFNGYTEQSTVTSFSVAKSVLSALVGIAIGEGKIGSVQDPITKYLPELGKRDARFGKITIEDLLTMSSGLSWHPEDTSQGSAWLGLFSGRSGLFSDDSEAYWNPNLRALALQQPQVAGPPGTYFLYNKYNALLIGMILERATHQSISHYLQEKLWKPLGMEAAGSWSLDSTQDGFEKSESGLNGCAIDFAKLGQLFPQRGTWQGRQLIPAAWVDESTAIGSSGSHAPYYAYFWWGSRLDGTHIHYYAWGNKGQFIYVAPEQQLVFVRFGKDDGGQNWPGLFDQLSSQVAQIDARWPHSWSSGERSA